MGIVVKSTPEILQAIVGTAGHVDHGKTSLVKLLTGCETDRLPEEKARGMSIDLGFAPCQLRGRRLVGIVDVPGHKDFIRNMVAGATSIDVLLLIVAADDGVMPQTDEHVKIIRLLRAPQVMVALTKIDMVDPEMLELARQDVAAFMARAGFPDAPIIPVSNKTGEGVGEVRDTIDQLVERARQSAPNGRAFRMNIERIFAVKGYGTVVTGIPMSGQVNVGDKLELLPAGRELTVRAIQSYKHDAEHAVANCCCAINVRDVEPEQLARGMTVAAPAIYTATDEVIVSVQNASDAHRLKRRFTAMFHAGTAAVEASLKLLDVETLAPGQEALAHVALTESVVVTAGDRFILRAISPAETLGGGTILSSRPQKLRRHDEQQLGRFQQAAEAAARGDFLVAELLAGPGVIFNTTEMLRLTRCPEPVAREQLGAAQKSGFIADLEGGACAILPRMNEAIESLAHALEHYHRDNPYTWGMTPAHVCQHLDLDPKNFARFSKLITAGGTLAMRNGRLALASFKPPVSAHLMNLRDQILAQIHTGGVNPPARGNLMKELSITEADMRILTRLLTEDGTIIFLDGNFMLRTLFEECRAKLVELFRDASSIGLPAFRDAIGTNRKIALAMLDAFDAEGLTRRIGDERVLARPAVVQKGDAS